MKIGDYVRYAKWNYKEKSQDVRIAKIKDIQTETGYNQKFIFFENGNGEYEDRIIKSSPNIIDLIQEGDYVNGRLVHNNLIYLTEFGWVDFDTLEQTDTRQIKSIVTKEQFSSMEYKIGE